MKAKRYKKYNKKTKRKKQIRLDRAIKILFAFAIVFYCSTKIGLYSYNITLSVQDQKLTKVMNAQQKKVDKLTSDVNILQEKSRVLGLLDDKVADNQKNVYIID